MAKDVDFRYNELYAELEMYLACVENLIKQFEDSSNTQNKLLTQLQVIKLKPLVKLVRSGKRSMSLENLNKCKNVFMKFYNKVNKRDSDSVIVPGSSKHDDFETVRAKLNLLVSKAKMQRDNYSKETNDTSLEPQTVPSVKNESSNTALSAYMNSHIALNKEYSSKKSEESQSTNKDCIKNENKNIKQSSLNLYHRREFKLDKTEGTSKERQNIESKNNDNSSKRSQKYEPEKKSSFKERDKNCKKSEIKNEPTISINEETDIDILEEIRSEIVKKLELEGKPSNSMKINKNNEKSKNKIDRNTLEKKLPKSTSNSSTKIYDSPDKTLKLNNTGIKTSNKTVFNTISVNNLDKANKDNIIDDEIEKALNKEICGIEISLPPSNSAVKKETLVISSTKMNEKSTSRRISLDTYKEKISTTTDQKPLHEENVIKSSKQPLSSCPASPDPEDCQNSNSIITTTPIPIEEKFKTLDIIQPTSLEWPITVKKEWIPNQNTNQSYANPISTNYSPQTYMNLIGSPLYRTNMANVAPKCTDVDMRQFPIQPSPSTGGFPQFFESTKTDNFVNNSLTTSTPSPVVGSPNFTPFNRIDNYKNQNIGNAPKSNYRTITQEPSFTIVDQSTESLDDDFKKCDNSHQFQRGRSTQRDDFVRGKSQNKDSYFRGRSMGRNEREKSISRNQDRCIGENTRERSIGREVGQYSIGRNERGKSIGKDFSQYNMGRNVQREKSLGRNMGDYNMGRNEREKFLGRNMSEYSMGRNEREKSLGRNMSEYNMGRNERGRSMGKNSNQFSMGRNDREKSLGRNMSENSMGRNEREKSLGRNMSEYNMGRNERGRSIGKNSNQFSMGRNDREKSLGRNFNEFAGRNINDPRLIRNNREKSMGRSITDCSMGRNYSEYSGGRFDNKFNSVPYKRDFNNTDHNFGMLNRDCGVRSGNNEQSIGQYNHIAGRYNNQYNKGNMHGKFHWTKNSNTNFPTCGNLQIKNEMHSKNTPTEPNTSIKNEMYSKNTLIEQNTSKVSITEKPTVISQKVKNSTSTTDDSKKSILNYKIPRIKKPDSDLTENMPSSQTEEKAINTECVPANSDANQVGTLLVNNMNVVVENEVSKEMDSTEVSKEIDSTEVTKEVNSTEATKEVDSTVVSTGDIKIEEEEDKIVVQSSQQSYLSIEEADSTNKLNEYDDDTNKLEDESSAQASNEASSTALNKDGDKGIFDDKTFYTYMETLSSQLKNPQTKTNAIPEKYIKIIEMFNDLKSKEEENTKKSVEENVTEPVENVSESVENVSEPVENVSESVENVSEFETGEVLQPIKTTEEQNKNPINDKKLDKGNRELRMLQQDLRHMFILRGVLEANGKRVVKSTPEYKETEKIERPKRMVRNNTENIVEDYSSRPKRNIKNNTDSMIEEEKNNTSSDSESQNFESSPTKYENESSDISTDNSPIKVTRRSLRNKPVIAKITTPQITKKVSPKTTPSFATKKKLKKTKNKILKNAANKELVPVAEKLNLTGIPESQIDSTKQCLQCKTSRIRDVVFHFKTRHPKEDIPTSKLNDEVAKNVIELAKSGFTDIFHTPSSQKCAFCEKLFDIEFPKSLLHHIAYFHTGEYEVNCNNCVHLSNGRCTYDCIENKLFGKQHPTKKGSDVKGFICELCNYVQISEDTLRRHVFEAHPNQEYKIFEISLTLNTNTSNLIKNLDIPNEQPVETESINKSINEEPENMDLDNINPSLDGIFSSSRNISLPNFDSSYDDTINNIKQELILDYDQHEMEELAKSLEFFESNNLDGLPKNIVKVSNIKMDCETTGFTNYLCPVEDCGYSNTILSEYEAHLISHDEENNFIWDGYCDICEQSETFNDYSVQNLTILNAFKHVLSIHMPAYLKKAMRPDSICTDLNEDHGIGSTPIRIANVFSLAQNISESSTLQEISIDRSDLHNCSFCDLTYPDEEMLLKHFVLEHIEAGTYEHFFKCAVESCKTECHQSNAFSEHLINSHPNNTSWKCIYCDIVIPNHNKLLVVHMQKDHCFEAFKCKMCDFRSNVASKMSDHLENTHGSNFKYSFLRIPYNALPENIQNTTDDLYICSACDFSSNSDISFRDHFSKDKACLNCLDCNNKTFKSGTAAFMHFYKVHICRNISCNYCNFRTISPKAMKRHGNKVHKSTSDVSWRIIVQHELQSNNKYFSCSSCYFSSGYPSELLDHFRFHEKNDPNLYTCKYCNNNFECGVSLVTHLYAMHFPWAYLSKMYDFDKSDLPHVDEPPPVQAYKCNGTNKKFISKESFRNHFLTCPVKHKCQICDYDLHDTELLISHLSDAHNFREYSCVYCDYANDGLDLLNVHITTEHKNKTPFTFMRYHVEESITGVLLLLNLNNKRHLFHQVVTDFKKVKVLQPKLKPKIEFISDTESLNSIKMAISTESNVTNVFKQGNTDQSISANNSVTENYKERNKEGNNSDSDDDALYIDDESLNETKDTTKDNLDFKTVILERTSIDSNKAVTQSLIKPILKMRNELPVTNLKGIDLFRCGGLGCDYSCETSKKFQSHTYTCPLAKKYLYCFHCSELFDKVSVLLHHIMTHGSCKYICDICKISLTSSKIMSTHMRRSHSVLNVTFTPLDPKKKNPDSDTFIARSHDKVAVEACSVLVQLAFGPTEIDSIPNRPIFSSFVKCKNCTYENKVRTNIIRHLQMHLNEDDSSIPTSAPVNPVPHLETNEMYFDKMTNLALSSNIDKIQDKTPAKNEINIFDSSPTPSDKEDKYPKFVIENKRFVCGSAACVYTSISEEMLRRHWESLHGDEEAFRCQHCDVYLTKIENSSMISVISQHFHLHKEKLYKCSSCDFLADEINYVKSHAFKTHNHKIFVTIRENVVDNNQTMNWRCAFCDVKTALKKEIMEHVQVTHKYRDQYKCGECGIFRPTYNTMTSHFKKFHTDLPLNMTPSFHNVNETLEITPENRKRALSATNTEVSTPKKQKISKTPTIEIITIDPNWTFGHPENGKYTCSICNKFSSADVEEFESHLRKELKYHRYGCTFCNYTSHSENAVITHSIDEHGICEVKLLSKNTKTEQWITDYLTHQKSKLKKESPNTSSQSSLQEYYEQDSVDSECALKSYSEIKTEDAYDFVDDSPSDKVKKCPYCDGFVGKNLRIHIMRHKGVKPYKCHYCDYDAVTMIEVRLHQRRSHKTLPLKVISKEDTCSKETDTPKKLKYVRKNMKQYVCTVCKASVSLEFLADHKSICHPNSSVELILFKSSNVLVCSICGSYAVNESLMGDHFKSIHPGAVVAFTNQKLGAKTRKLFRRFSCKYCLVNYTEYGELLNHFQSIHPHFPIQITAYTTSSVMTTGEISMKGDFKCIITGCDETLKNPLDLLYHVRHHYESYHCESCSLLFTSFSKYSNHSCSKKIKILKNEADGAILKQRLPQIYQIIVRMYEDDFISVTCEDYLKNKGRPDGTDVIEIKTTVEPAPKKLKQVAKKSTTQVNAQFLKYL